MTPALPARRGGQTKVSRERLQRYLQLIQSGLTQGQAARSIGISEPTRANWMRRGRLEATRLQDAGTDLADLLDPTEKNWPTDDTWTHIPPGVDPYEWPFLIFAIGAEKALAEFEARNVAVIQRAATGNAQAGVNPQWQAAAWLLERRFPQLYGRAEARLKQQVEVTVSPGQPGSDQVVSVDDLQGKLLELDEADLERAR